MKKLLILFSIICVSLNGFTQEDLLQIDKELDEVAVSPPTFTGVNTKYLTDGEISDRVLQKYLIEQLIFPEKSVKCEMEGTEVVRFDVTADGELTNFKIINSVCREIDREVIHVLQSTNGMWKPGNRDNKTVVMSKEISIPFVLNSLHLENYESVEELFLSIAERYYNKGTTSFFKKEKPKKALRAFDRAINYLPNDPSLLLTRGLCRYEVGDREGARRDWERAEQFGLPHNISGLLAQSKDMKGHEELSELIKK